MSLLHCGESPSWPGYQHHECARTRYHHRLPTLNPVGPGRIHHAGGLIWIDGERPIQAGALT